ncbi:uncharacterized protein MONOS_15331 [Monocercomonoides exilis]|uniref:uncharacterized protein n=1 Tax=Monocercomonoides exilis TaxID=2049356 RepID=UPI00355A7E97|nr:hypothetical protein MONOS_15331 [Monocercomonoides exilis]|eukprot:MONOS_15331.1-p1 / transcript=MONOS_15331.1 / gene=MONOS_15331 / organism=Monocercomonoides_exilis_PA203 / gene_product=unspecified product / transcript_product=unspecified product / location=Mono_scaffold01199:8913-10125(+) / protein_length=276 / sequence_SO=supercontig / SO=protein_coding / is_pseudo=false
MAHQFTQLDRDDAILKEIHDLEEHHKQLDEHIEEYTQFLQQSLRILYQEQQLMTQSFKDSMEESSKTMTDLESKLSHARLVHQAFNDESSRILDLHHIEVEKERELLKEREEKKTRLESQISSLSNSTEESIRAEAEKRIQPFSLKLKRASERRILMEAKAKAEEEEYAVAIATHKRERQRAEESFLRASDAWNEDIKQLSEMVEELRNRVKDMEAIDRQRKFEEKQRKEAEAEEKLKVEMEIARLGLYGKAGKKMLEKKLMEEKMKKKKKKKRC